MENKIKWTVWVWVFVLVILGIKETVEYEQNVRPIIGILAQPTYSTLVTYGSQYIVTSYVKYVESAGAMAVPIFYDSGTENITQLLQNINGVLLPGGSSTLEGDYLAAISTIYQYVINANDNGDYFPLWGTCQGFEQICQIVANNFSVLSHFCAENYTVPLNFTEAASNSILFTNISQNIFKALATQPITMNDHKYGVSPKSWEENKQLASFFTVLSYNNDRDGNTFVSSMESNNYPIYATQFHPEKPLFEWTPLEVISHTKNAILASQYLANFFIDECRNNLHTFPSDTEEMSTLIYNYADEVVYTGELGYLYEQSYIFPPSNTTKVNK